LPLEISKKKTEESGCPEVASSTKKKGGKRGTKNWDGANAFPFKGKKKEKKKE